MRYIKLRHIIDDTDKTAPVDFGYLDAIKAILSGASVPQGVTFGEMEQALNILAKCKGLDQDAGQYLELEDAEHVFLCDWVKSHRWRGCHDVIKEFCETVIKAPNKRIGRPRLEQTSNRIGIESDGRPYEDAPVS
jgi:hypothetical protein